MEKSLRANDKAEISNIGCRWFLGPHWNIMEVTSRAHTCTSRNHSLWTSCMYTHVLEHHVLPSSSGESLRHFSKKMKNHVRQRSRGFAGEVGSFSDLEFLSKRTFNKLFSQSAQQETYLACNCARDGKAFCVTLRTYSNTPRSRQKWEK